MPASTTFVPAKPPFSEEHTDGRNIITRAHRRGMIMIIYMILDVRTRVCVITAIFSVEENQLCERLIIRARQPRTRIVLI